MANVEVSISELRKFVNQILDRIASDVGKDRLQLLNDNYWDVAVKERYDFSQRPQDLESGQLSDDWEFLTGLLQDDQQAVRPMLVHVAAILRAIGEHEDLA